MRNSFNEVISPYGEIYLMLDFFTVIKLIMYKDDKYNDDIVYVTWEDCIEIIAHL